MNIIDHDEPYRAYLKEHPLKLKEVYSDAISAGQLPIDGTLVTTTILLRLRAHFISQREAMLFLKKRYSAQASDFFVETVLFFLRVFAETHRLEIDAVSERKFLTPQGPIRPDISLWRGSKAIGLIECKTQLGWNRQKWETDFAAREAQLHSLNNSARAFLVVMTTENWPGFGSSERLGRDYFVLSSAWPSNLDGTDPSSNIVTPIERLFAEIKSMVTGRVQSE